MPLLLGGGHTQNISVEMFAGKNTWTQIVPEINLAPEKCKIKIGWNILSMDLFELFIYGDIFELFSSEVVHNSGWLLRFAMVL